MNVLLENPIPIIFLGILVEAVLGVVLLRSGRGVIVWAMAGVLVLVLAAVGLEWLVVTDRERVEATIEGTAASVAANSPDRALERLHPSAVKARQLLLEGFRLAEFTDVNVTHLEVLSINRLASPTTATVRVKGLIHFQLRRGEDPYNRRPFDITLKLRRESDRWLITDEFEWEEDPRG